jgi:hypothetical protein
MGSESAAPFLFVIMVGGQFTGQRIEFHDIEIYVAADEIELIADSRNVLRPGLKAKHIDGWIKLPVRSASAADIDADGRLYLAELGQSRADSFYEQHDYALIIARDSRAAIRAAKAGHPGWHVDNLIDLSREAAVLGHSVHARTAREEAHIVSRYIRL